jgi:hypothetical protein
MLVQLGHENGLFGVGVHTMCQRTTRVFEFLHIRHIRRMFEFMGEQATVNGRGRRRQREQQQDSVVED